MTQAKKLIEVAMPIKEISAECVRDDRIQHGHISSLHKWWARRPLPVCRAVVFASLVPDPLDENCPQQFKDAIEMLLGSAERPLQVDGMNIDPYKPYSDIPWTAVFDPMEDNLRNRLQMYIGKFSIEMQQHLLGKTLKPTASKLINDLSLIKWENKNNNKIIEKAQKLIFISHQCINLKSTLSAQELIEKFENLHGRVRQAEKDLFNLTDRHRESKKCIELSKNLQDCIEAFLDQMPRVFDPFAGGGAIPLEASRLGCRSFGNDLNPVAHIVQKGSLEFPQKFGKPIIYSKEEFIKIYGNDKFDLHPTEDKLFQNGEPVAAKINNRLSFDVNHYATKALQNTKKEISPYYPEDENGVAPRIYYWIRVGICMNPSCKAEVPLMKQFYVCNKEGKQIYLNPVIDGKKIDFELKNGKCELEGWIKGGNLVCPCCKNVTTSDVLKNQFITGVAFDKLVCVIKDGVKGKEYSKPSETDIEVISKIPKAIDRPTESLPVKYTKAMAFCLWGFEEWGQLFSDRQILAINSLIKSCKDLSIHDSNTEYTNAIKTYLGIWIDRMAARLTKFGIIDLGGEKVVDLFGLQAIQMVFDYPEVNLLKLEQLSWIEKYIESESQSPFVTNLSNVSSGEKLQFDKKYITVVVTDPPYYDAIAYADLSDFFYIWLKKSIGDIYPLTFSTPQTPKSEECTALKHHHGSNENAKMHFENKLLQIFDAIEYQTSDLVSIMFAHQSTEAWTTLCNSILGARMNITGSWAIGTEKKGGLKENKAFLSSSVTVCAKPTKQVGDGNFREVKKAIETTVAKEVEELYRLGFRGADLLTACFGQAVSEFGKYQKVEKADGSEVSVAELLEMARESAFNALLKGFEGDDFTKFYIGWLQLYSFTESEFDDAAKFSRVGLSINVAELFTEHILIKHGNKQTLGTFEERINANKNIGDRANNFLIDLVHRAMALYKGNNRSALLLYIAKVAAQPESSFWRVITSLCEVLPNGSEDHKQALGLLTNKDSLIRESKNAQTTATTQANLFE